MVLGYIHGDNTNWESVARQAGTGRSAADNHFQLALFGYACGLGTPVQGCARGPDSLKRAGLAEALQSHGLSAAWIDILRQPEVFADATVVSVLHRLVAALAKRVTVTMKRGHRFAVIGGDHSSAIGTWSGAALGKQGPLGLIWIDAHMDAHTPATSPSGAVHGMPLACLLGYGAPAFTQLLHPDAKIAPEHLCLIGVRSFELEEARLLDRLGVRVIPMDEIRSRGLGPVLDEALDIALDGTVGFGISIDLDAIDPMDAPGVSTPVPDGLRGDTLVECMTQLAWRPEWIGMEIAEYNPMRDHHGMTADLIKRLLLAVMTEGVIRQEEDVHAPVD